MYIYNLEYEMDGGLLENEFLLPSEVMELLRIGKNTVYNMLASGELPATRVGKQWRISKRTLLALHQADPLAKIQKGAAH